VLLARSATRVPPLPRSGPGMGGTTNFPTSAFMISSDSGVRYACAPVSWGVQDDPGPGWKQPYEQVLDEIVSAGYEGTELGPYGYFPTDPEVLRPVLRQHGLALLSSFVPVPLTNEADSASVVNHVRRVGSLLSALEAPVLVLSGRQTPERQELAGRVPADGSKSLTAKQWKQVGKIVAEIETAASDYGLRLVFHPHVATYVETPWEVEHLFDSLRSTTVGLCLDTGHCLYGGGDPVEEARKYRTFLHYLHIKDVDATRFAEARQNELTFNEAVEAGVFSPVGQGCVPFPEFFKQLSSQRYSGWMVVEQDIIYGRSAIPPVESMRTSLDYLTGIAEGAKRETSA
jgi:inosose dehydratase